VTGLGLPVVGRSVQGLVREVASEVAKFLTVGGVATAVSVVIFNALVHGDWALPATMNRWPLPAYVIANSVGMLVSYRGSRSWAFRHREVVGRAGGRIAFFVINLLSMAIPLLCLAFSRYLLHRDDPVADNIAANGVGLVLGTAARFWAFRRFVFVRPQVAEARQQRLAETRGQRVA
jgi:putative flippase GtrA